MLDLFFCQVSWSIKQAVLGILVNDRTYRVLRTIAGPDVMEIATEVIMCGKHLDQLEVDESKSSALPLGHGRDYVLCRCIPSPLPLLLD